jgi:hypothetical protein
MVSEEEFRANGEEWQLELAVQLAHEQRSKTVGPSASGTRAAHRRAPAAAVLKVAPGERLPARGHNAPV